VAAAHAVVLVAQVQPRRVLAGRLQLPQPDVRSRAQVAELAVDDRLGRARLRARRRLVVLEPVVAERALPRAPVPLAPLDDPERARGDAVAAAVADIGLHDDGVELGPEQRARRAHLQARGRGAVLADVGGHQPAHRLVVGLLDERHVAPRVGAERLRVVV
jgi:hypothetical protein